MAIGREVAPHVKKHGSKLLPDSVKKPKEEGGRSTLDDVVTVAAGGLQGKKQGDIFRYSKRRLIRSSKITNPWDCVLKHTYHFMIWHAPQQNSSAAKLPAKLPNLMGLRLWVVRSDDKCYRVLKQLHVPDVYSPSLIL